MSAPDTTETEALAKCRYCGLADGPPIHVYGERKCCPDCKHIAPETEALAFAIRRANNACDAEADFLASDWLATRDAAQRAAADAALDDALRERDEAQEWADRLAYAIAPMEVIGEHTSSNNPWKNALDAARAAERALVERVEELHASELARLTTPDRPEPLMVPMLGNYLGGISTTAADLRAALRPEAATTEGERWSAIDQTIMASDPSRLGNCVSACVATYLGIELEQVPHFLEVGQHYGGKEDKSFWWCHLFGFMAAHGLHGWELDSLDEVNPDEVAFVAGMSDRGVLHQVLYRNGELWHDPHPSKSGVRDVVEVLVWRPSRYDHTPTPPRAARGEGEPT